MTASALHTPSHSHVWSARFGFWSCPITCLVCIECAAGCCRDADQLRKPESISSHLDTTINSAQSQAGGAYVAPDAWHLVFTNLPPYCEVQATIAPTPDSSIKVRVWMPTQRYNGRFLGTGNGGYAGGFFFSELADGINRGFATANTDMGATGAAGREWRRARRASGKMEGLRLARDAPDDGVRQGAHQYVLRRSGETFLLCGLLHRRPAGTNGSAALSQ